MRQSVFLFVLVAIGSNSVHASTEDGDANAQAALTGVTWQLEAITSAGELLRPDDPSAYTVVFEVEGRLTVQADCNRGVGRYLTAGDSLAVQVGFTRALCPPGSLFDVFSRHLAASSSFVVTRERLELTSYGGSMSFVNAERPNGDALGTESNDE